MASLVQSAGNTVASGSSVTVTLSPTGSRNCLVVLAGSGSSSASHTVSSITLGSTGDTFAKAVNKTVTGFNFDDGEAWTDQGCSGGQTALTVSFSGTGALAAIVMEWSGIFTSGAVDVATGGTGSNSTSWSSGASGALAQASEVVIGAVFADATSAPSLTGPGGAWTNLAGQAPSTDFELLAGYQVVSSNGTLTYSGTAGHSSYTCAVIISLKASPATQNPVPPLIPPGIGSPMNFRRQAWPVAPPFTVSNADTGSGADFGAGGQLGSPGRPLTPPGFRSPMAWQRKPLHIPPALPTFVSDDTGTGADAGTVHVTGADTGSGADAGQVSQEADTGTGTEAGTVTATVPGAETGSGAESAIIGGVKAADTGAGADADGSVTVRPLLTVRWSAPDKLDKAGGVMQ